MMKFIPYYVNIVGENLQNWSHSIILQCQGSIISFIVMSSDDKVENCCQKFFYTKA